MHTDLKSLTQSYGAQYIDEQDISAVVEVLRSSHLTCGAMIEKFEDALAKNVGAKYAVACSNGTTALHLASIVAGVGSGDYVIVPTITFLATANAARYCGADVVFCDVDPKTALITYDTLLAAINRAPKRPTAVYLVDIAGQHSCSAQIRELCLELGIKIIQDASHALGSTFKVNGALSIVGDNKFADLTTFSFHPVKNITTGEGGAVTTNDPTIYERLKLLRSHGMIRETSTLPWYYEMRELGFNYRLTDIQAALGLSQVKKLNSFKVKRAELKACYDRLLANYREYVQILSVAPEADPCWHLYIVLIDFAKLGLTRAKVMQSLADRKIGSQVHYIPVHSQTYYQKLYGDLSLPAADEYYAKTLSLPLHVHLSVEDIQYIVSSLLDILGVA